MENYQNFDVIIVGGSYAGLSAAMALGRSLRRVLVIDSGKPCNRQTPHSHNFLTHDGSKPAEIAAIARQQVAKYDTVKFFDGLAVGGTKTENGFRIQTASGESFAARKLIFASGVRDIMPEIDGYSECWGISVLHCPYCHGYEVKSEKTGILANGELGFEFAMLISNWTKELTLYTNGPSHLAAEHVKKLAGHGIKIAEAEVAQLKHTGGRLQQIVFKDGSTASLKALYARSAFEQHCAIPAALGCELTEQGLLKIDPMQKTSVPGVFACGDNVTSMRSVANAVAQGTFAGAVVNREMVMEDF